MEHTYAAFLGCDCYARIFRYKATHLYARIFLWNSLPADIKELHSFREKPFLVIYVIQCCLCVCVVLCLLLSYFVSVYACMFSFFVSLQQGGTYGIELIVVSIKK